MKKNLLIAGDSFSSDWTKKYNKVGWVNLLDQFNVTNVSQAGVSEYKIYKQLENQKLDQYDQIIVCHTSPYRIHVQKHPIHSQDILHKDSDLIYNDLLVSKENPLAKVAVDFFEHFFDLDYAVFVHKLIVNQIKTIVPNAIHITFFDNDQNNLVSFYDVFSNHRGLINHLTDEGNKIMLAKINELLSQYN